MFGPSSPRPQRCPLTPLRLRQEATGVTREVGGEQDAWESEEEEQDLGQNRVALGGGQRVREVVDDDDLARRGALDRALEPLGENRSCARVRGKTGPIDAQVQLERWRSLEKRACRSRIHAQRWQYRSGEQVCADDDDVRDLDELALVVGRPAREQGIGL